MVAGNAKTGHTEISNCIFLRENLGCHARYSSRRLGIDNVEEVGVIFNFFFIFIRYNIINNKFIFDFSQE